MLCYVKSSHLYEHIYFSLSVFDVELFKDEVHLYNTASHICRLISTVHHRQGECSAQAAAQVHTQRLWCTSIHSSSL